MPAEEGVKIGLFVAEAKDGIASTEVSAKAGVLIGASIFKIRSAVGV